MASLSCLNAGERTPDEAEVASRKSRLVFLQPKAEIFAPLSILIGGALLWVVACAVPWLVGIIMIAKWTLNAAGI